MNLLIIEYSRRTKGKVLAWNDHPEPKPEAAKLQ